VRVLHRAVARRAPTDPGEHEARQRDDPDQAEPAHDLPPAAPPTTAEHATFEHSSPLLPVRPQSGCSPSAVRLAAPGRSDHRERWNSSYAAKGGTAGESLVWVLLLLGGACGQAADDLGEHAGVGVDRREPRLCALRGLVREAAGAVGADVEHEAVPVED